MTAGGLPQSFRSASIAAISLVPFIFLRSASLALAGKRPSADSLQGFRKHSSIYMMSTSRSLDLKEREGFRHSIPHMQNTLLAQSARLEDLAEVGDARNDLKGQLEDMQNQLRLITSERDRLGVDFAAAEDRARTAETDRVELESKLKMLSNKITDAIIDRLPLQERLEQTMTKLQEAEKSLRHHTRRRESLEGRVRDLEGLPIHQIQQAVDKQLEFEGQYHQRYNDLSNKVSGLEEDNDDLRRQLSSSLKTKTKTALEKEALERKLEAAIDDKNHWKIKYAEELPSLQKKYQKEIAALKQDLDQERNLRPLLQKQRASDWHDATPTARPERRKRLREAESSEEDDVRANIPRHENIEAQQYRAVRDKSNHLQNLSRENHSRVRNEGPAELGDDRARELRYDSTGIPVRQSALVKVRPLTIAGDLQRVSEASQNKALTRERISTIGRESIDEERASPQSSPELETRRHLSPDHPRRSSAARVRLGTSEANTKSRRRDGLERPLSMSAPADTSHTESPLRQEWERPSIESEQKQLRSSFEEAPPAREHRVKPVQFTVDQVQSHDFQNWLPRVVQESIRYQFLLWDKKWPDWREKATDAAEKCMTRRAQKQGTSTIESDVACRHCEGELRVCIRRVAGGQLALAPLRAEIRKGEREDAEYWIKTVS
ncbi:hypothetical protein LTS15_004692 [Exophiala xenobiotica]|nr:hypothetical protein LTS15_004692 [Exophiala xenobiotica]